MTALIPILLFTGIPAVSSGTPNRQPQLAAANGVVALVFGSGRSVIFAQSRDSGETFSDPVAIAEVPVLALGRHRGPRIVFSRGTMLVSAVGGGTLAAGEHAHGLPADGNLLMWRSTDAGKTWLKPVIVNDSPGSAREGLHAMAADEKGNVAAVWLDLRSNGTRLYGSFSNDAGATWSKNVLVYESPDGTICQCCHPSIAVLGPGEFAVMFRNAIAGSRDMYLMRMRDGRVITKAERLGADSWKLEACPMDGGGIATANGRIMTAWRRGGDIFLAEPGAVESRIGTGKDVALATQNGKTYAAWVRAGAVAAWMAGKVERLSESGAFPVLTPLPDGGVVAAWEEGGVIKLRRLH